MSTIGEGGEEASLQILGSCRYRDQLHIISIKNSSSLRDLYVNLARRWNEIESELFTLQYLAPREKLYVTLSNDDDVANMVLLHLILKLNIIDILVSRKDEPPGRGRMASDVCR